jgi:hypothetical protein
MKKPTLNKDGTLRKRRTTKKSANNPLVTLPLGEIELLLPEGGCDIPVSEEWVKGRLYAKYLEGAQVTHDFSKMQSLEDTIEYALTDFNNE